MKRETPPYTPCKRKAKGKENSRDVYEPRPSRARVRATRLAREIDAQLDIAVTAFDGTHHDRALWAAIAWRVGLADFREAVANKIAENRVDGMPRKPAAAFQKLLNDRFPLRTQSMLERIPR